MKEPRWVPRVVVDSIHLDQLREHGGLPGVQDENALEAALARARQKWHDDPSSDQAILAAAYGFGLARAHPYSDGNKRMAFVTMMTFLGLNAKDLSATELEVVQMIVALAGGELTESALADWIRGRLIRFTL